MALYYERMGSPILPIYRVAPLVNAIDVWRLQGDQHDQHDLRFGSANPNKVDSVGCSSSGTGTSGHDT